VDIRKVVDGQRKRRAFRVRKRVRGTAERPRLCVYRSLQNFGCQVIDDEAGKTLCSVSSSEKELRGEIGYGGNCTAAAKLVRFSPSERSKLESSRSRSIAVRTNTTDA